MRAFNWYVNLLFIRRQLVGILTVAYPGRKLDYVSIDQDNDIILGSDDRV